MWRMKVTAVSLVVLGALIFGSVVAYAGWGWNAEVNIGGSGIHTYWTVENDEDGSTDYRARITVTIPKEADASIVEVAPNRIEKVRILHSGDLECTPEGIMVNVVYKVTHKGGSGGGYSWGPTGLLTLHQEV